MMDEFAQVVDKLKDSDVDCTLSADECTLLVANIKALQSCVKDNNKGIRQLVERVLAYTGQLEAWGYDAAAFDMLTEILGGSVNAPDYYALRAQLGEALDKIKELEARIGEGDNDSNNK